MSQVVNLNKARKARAKAEAGEKAAQNRITHGTPKALRDLAAVREAKARAELDAKKRED